MFLRERPSWPSLLTDTGNITTDEAHCNKGSNSFLGYKYTEQRLSQRITNTADGKTNSDIQCDQ